MTQEPPPKGQPQLGAFSGRTPSEEAREREGTDGAGGATLESAGAESSSVDGAGAGTGYLAAGGMTSGDLARLLDVDLKTIHNWVRNGHLQGRRTKGRHLRFSRTEVARFMRKFGYRIPDSVGDAPPRAVLAGFTPRERAEAQLSLEGQIGARGAASLEECEHLFDAALLVASTEVDVLALALGRFDARFVEELLVALRRRPGTFGLSLVGVSESAEVRERFLAAGGHVALAQARELGPALLWLVGAVSTAAFPGATSGVVLKHEAEAPSGGSRASGE
jgi:excisionase family DNA binding protein